MEATLAKHRGGALEYSSVFDIWRKLSPQSLHHKGRAWQLLRASRLLIFVLLDIWAALEGATLDVITVCRRCG